LPEPPPLIPLLLEEPPLIPPLLDELPLIEPPLLLELLPEPDLALLLSLFGISNPLNVFFGPIRGPQLYVIARSGWSVFSKIQKAVSGLAGLHLLKIETI
jgi:hypothetical protein